MALGALSIASESTAATYYVDAAAPNDSGAGTQADPKQTITAGIALMSGAGGDTLLIADGSYTETLANFRSGAEGNYNIVRAENDGGVIVQGAVQIDGGTQFVQIEGLKVVYAGQGSGIADAHHIKILRTAFEGGPPQGNTYSFAIGSNDFPTEYILLEDCWIYGSGGRQNLPVYKTDKVVLRRVVLRHDLGWSNIVKPDPEGTATIYNSNDVEVQNLVVVDSYYNPANEGSAWSGALTIVNNQNSGGTNRDNFVRGAIVLNVDGNAFELGGDGAVEAISFEDIVVWWSADTESFGGAFAMNNPGFKSAVVERATVGRTANGVALWGGTNSAYTLRNSIVYQMSQFPIGVPDNGDGTITDEFNNCFGNANENCADVGLVTTDPMINGLLHLPRIEDGSALLTAGDNGGRIGAVVLNRIGVSGTLWGEPGYDTVTDEPLWPWPHQARIHADMSAVSDRGFAADGETLTNYIWSALGTPTPDDVDDVDDPAGTDGGGEDGSDGADGAGSDGADGGGEAGNDGASDAGTGGATGDATQGDALGTEDQEDTGCGCKTSRPPHPTAVFGGVLLGLLGLRRRGARHG